MGSSPTRALLAIGRAVRDRVRRAILERKDGLSAPAGRAAGDLQYGLDRVSEGGLLDLAGRAMAGLGPVRVLAEGLAPEGVMVGRGAPTHFLVLDPVDGTRGLMHDKRSAFVLLGLAEATAAPRLSDLVAAAMVEIPTTRSHLSDLIWAERGRGARGATEDVLTGAQDLLPLRPSEATDLRHGFGTIVRFFGGAAEALGRLHDDLVRRLHEEDPAAAQDVFEDQYISNGGQMHALITGRDRFVADLRPLFRGAGETQLRCAHPYDVLGELIATEAGVVITDAAGDRLDPPLDLTTPVAWVGYANPRLRARVEPVLQAALGAARR
jgi:fructose-1,6-bisphosphatase/inositol monophosphatase family enzyme